MELDQKTQLLHMQRCIRLAQMHDSNVDPPYVGALVLSRDLEVIGEGYKKLIGGTTLAIHAERMALEQAGEETRGGILFTTLIPCVPYFRNSNDGPLLKTCGELIIESGIRMVVYGIDDKNKNFQCNPKGYISGRSVKVQQFKGLEGDITRVSDFYQWVSPTTF